MLSMVAGQAAAQPVIDGTREGDEAFYQTLKWVQTNPTSFGDNTPANVPGSGDPENVTTGVEIVIPLASIGNPAGEIAIAGYVSSGDHTFASNQFIGSLPNFGNQANPSDIDLSTIDGDQNVAFTPMAAGSAPDVDGDLDSVYGDALFLQTNFTGFGDATHGNIDGGSGSEIDALYAVTNGGNLYLFVAGNLEANGNNLELFIDSVTGGENTISGDPGGIDGDALGEIQGLTFDSGFEADFYMMLSGENVNEPDDTPLFQTEAYFATLDDEAFFLGNGGYATDGTLSDGDAGAPSILATINNSNTVGVIDSPPVDIPSPDEAVGSELDGLYSYMDDEFLYVLLTGNAQSNFNKLNIFIDAQPGGQNTLNGENVDISFNGLNRMGTGANGALPKDEAPGLTFDQEMAPDWWLNYNIGGVPVQHCADAATLPTDGALTDPNGFALHYGMFDCNEDKAAEPVLNTDGPVIDVQDGFTTNLFTNYGPRTSNEALDMAMDVDPFDPPVEMFVEPMEILVAFDNSNIAGVTDTSADGAADVQTGMELRLALDEIGWDGSSPIRFTAMWTSGGFDFVSNQVTGSLPSDDNLGEVTQVNFSEITGEQFITLFPEDEPCPADFNNDGDTNVLDFIAFQAAFAQQDPDADCNDDSQFNVLDFICFQGVFAQGCP